jgi:prepilin-type N-terminal cleavage/methylation domain-containing protein
MRISRYEMRVSNLKSEIRNPRLRRGVTLIEVLIAMFVMAIGLTGVLSLFILGTSQFANAVKDERTLQTAQVVEGHARILWRMAYPTTTTTDAQAFTTEPSLQAFVNPDPGAGASGGGVLGQNEYVYNAAPAFPLIDPASTEASYPVYFDAIGRQTQRGNPGPWVAGITGLLPRRTLSIIYGLPSQAAQTTARVRLFSLIDDMTFTTTGKAVDPAANPPQSTVIRGGKYNAAFLLQRAANADNTKANLTIVVYQNRPVADTDSQETPLTNTQVPLYPGSTSVSFPNPGVPSGDLRKGKWILIAGQMAAGQNSTAPNPGHPLYTYANFYRIVSVQLDNANNYQLEISPPLKDCRPPQKYWNQPYFTGFVIGMENVAEVFERPVLSPLPVPAPN